MVQIITKSVFVIQTNEYDSSDMLESGAFFLIKGERGPNSHPNSGTNPVSDLRQASQPVQTSPII